MLPPAGTVIFFVGQGRASDGAESVIANQQPFFNAEAVANLNKRLTLATFGALSIAYVDRGDIVISYRQSRADAGIHATAQEYDCP